MALFVLAPCAGGSVALEAVGVSHFLVLGPVEAWTDEQRVVLGGPQQLVLLSFLLLNANRAVSADAVIDAVWGGERAGAAKHRLQTGVSRLRRALEPLDGQDRPRLRTISGGYLLSVAPGELDAEVLADGVREGRRALDANDAARAKELLAGTLRLWRGPPLAEVAFEDFAQPEIRRLEELRLTALESRIEADLRLGQHDELIPELERRLAENPTRERLAGQLMLALYRSGRQHDALEVYQRVRIHLGEELGLQPGRALSELQALILHQAPSLDADDPIRGQLVTLPPTEALLQNSVAMLRSHDERVRDVTDGEFGLLEREKELARIRSRLISACNRAGGLLLITGLAGIGKTALLGTAWEMGAAAGMRTLSARGGELEGEFSFGLVRQLFEPLLAESDRKHRQALLAGAARMATIALEGEDDDLGIGDRRFAATHGLYWLTVNLCRLAPLLVLIDDLHWADRASLRWVLYLANRLAGLPITVLLSWRTGEIPSDERTFMRLEEAAGDQRIEPAPLSPDAVRSFMVHHLACGVPAERLVHAASTVTGGNPFLLAQLVGSLRADQLEPNAAAAERVLQLGPRSVARSAALRIAQLGPSAAELARAVAILGDGTRVVDAATLAGLGMSDAARMADSLAGIGILEPRTPLRFVHAIVRSAVYEDIPAAERAARHGEAARTLAANGAEPDVVCAQLLVCEPAGSHEAVQHLEEAAADALARASPDSAAVYLRRALVEGIRDDDHQTALFHRLGSIEALMRQPAAIEHLAQASRLANDPISRARIACDLAGQLINSGQWTRVLALVERSLSDLAGRDLQVALRLQTAWARVASYLPRLVPEVERRLPSLRASAAGTGGVAGQELSLLLAWIIAAHGGEIDDVVELVNSGLGDGDFLASRGGDAWAFYQGLAALVIVEQNRSARDLLIMLRGDSRDRGTVAGLVATASLKAWLDGRCGDLVNSETELRTAVEQLQDLQLSLGLTLWHGADALIERPALRDLARIVETLDLPPARAATLELRGRLRLIDGRVEDAIDDLRASGALCTAMHFFNPNLMVWRAALAPAIMPADPREALRLAREQLTDAERIGLPRGIGIALRTLAAVEKGDRQIGLLHQAAEILGPSPARLEYARSLLDLGASLRRANRRSEAREPLRVGLDLAHQCGATRLAERARIELAATGARPRRMMVTGIEALAVSERRVAELAAQGLSNREIAQELFVTINTVEGHLRHVYQKLSIHSRRELPGGLGGPVSNASKDDGASVVRGSSEAAKMKA
jgi:DNA-binding SARP family transcriptional activator/DNA-binding CsgD family transcriptional regulator